MARIDQTVTPREWQRIVQFLVDDGDGRSAYEISQGAKVGTAKLYPALATLEHRGILGSAWQERSDGNPRRRLYVITDQARGQLRELLG